MARAYSGCEVWHQDFLSLDLPDRRFDGIFANAALFHVPGQELPRVLRELHAALKPGGVLVYCVCSLEPEECEDQIAALLTRDPRITRKPVTPQDVFERREFVTDDGDLRTLPMHLPDSDPRWGGLDGFYAARLTCKSA